MKQEWLLSYEEMRDISENKNFCIEDMLMKARANLEQDRHDESRRNDAERRRN